MTANEIVVLMHAHSGIPLGAENDAKWTRSARAQLILHGLLQEDTITDRGCAYIRMLLATPLPAQQWVDPR